VKLPVDLNPVIDGIRSISETMRTIRDSVALLPEVARTLDRIEDGVKFMGDEVHSMRKGVDELGVEVKGMRVAVDPLVAHMDIVAARIEALEPRLDDLNMAIHPLRRATGKLGMRRADDDLDRVAAAEEVPPPDGSLDE